MQLGHFLGLYELYGPYYNIGLPGNWADELIPEAQRDGGPRSLPTPPACYNTTFVEYRALNRK